MLLKIDPHNSSNLIIEDQDGVQAIFYVDENHITIEEINLDYYLKCLSLIEEYLFMKYAVISLWNSPIPLENWEEHETIYVKHKADSPYTISVSQKESL